MVRNRSKTTMYTSDYKVNKNSHSAEEYIDEYVTKNIHLYRPPVFFPPHLNHVVNDSVLKEAYGNNNVPMYPQNLGYNPHAFVYHTGLYPDNLISPYFFPEIKAAFRHT